MKKYLRTAANLFGAVAITTLMTLSVIQLTYAPEASAAKATNTCNSVPLKVADCPFLKDYVVPAINALSGALGVVVVIMVAWGGVQYTSAKDNPQQAAQAKEHIRDAIFALVIYIFMIALLNWLVPGGVF